jgi:hypothetical protein
MNKTKYFIAINIICCFSKNYRKNKYIDSKNLSEIKINFHYFKKRSRAFSKETVTRKFWPIFFIIANGRACEYICKSWILALSDCSLNRYDQNIGNIYRKLEAKLSRFLRLFSYFLCKTLLNQRTDKNSLWIR